MNVASLPQVMVAVAQNLSLSEVLRTVVQGIAGCANVVLTRLWLFGPGDLCASCRFADDCQDRTRCLHLEASAGNVTTAGVDAANLHGAFRRFPTGVRKIGRVAATGEPLLLSGLTGDEPWIVDRAWFQAEGVRAFAAQPLVFRGEVLGVLAVFDRQLLGDDDLRWLRVFADHAAVSIAHARAFEEIDRLRARLAAENDYLHEEVERAHGAAVELVAESDAMRRVVQQVRIVDSGAPFAVPPLDELFTSRVETAVSSEPAPAAPAAPRLRHLFGRRWRERRRGRANASSVDDR